jgi:hypothetical protein
MDQNHNKKKSLEGALTGSTQMLKISHESQISKTAFESIEKVFGSP